MKKIIPIICLAISFLAIAALLCFRSIRDGLWVEVPDTRITYDGTVASHSKVFESKDGDLLVYLEPGVIGQQPAQYFVYTHLNRIGVGSHGSILFGYAYVPSNHLETSVLSGTDKFPGGMAIDRAGHLDLTLPSNSHIAICLKGCVAK